MASGDAQHRIPLRARKNLPTGRFSVALEVLLSNKFMEDLDRLWALRPWIPDPNDPSTWK